MLISLESEGLFHIQGGRNRERGQANLANELFGETVNSFAEGKDILSSGKNRPSWMKWKQRFRKKRGGQGFKQQ